MTEKKSLPPLIQGYGAENVLRLLAPLRQSQNGNLIYKHVSHAVGEMERNQQKIALGYAAVLHNFINAVRKQLPRSSLLSQELKLIQQRLQPPITITELATIQAYLKNALHLVNEVTGEDDRFWHEALQPLINAATEPPAAMTATESVAPESEAETANISSSANINISDQSFANLPKPEMLEEKPNGHHNKLQQQDFEQQQNKLLNNIFDAMQHQARFGLLLEEMLQRLKKAETKSDVDNVRGHAIAELQSMLAEQSLLVHTLNETHDFANMVRQSGQRLSQELRQVRVLSLTDELTELPNRRAFMQRLDEELQRARRYKSNFCVAMVDLDHFKRINDSYGHAAGDVMLRKYANNILSVLRRSDMVARYGGEEFAIIFPNTSLDEAQQALEKVRARAVKTTIEYNNNQIHVPGFSAGLVQCDSSEDADSLINHADQMLYNAKEKGRDRIELGASAEDVTMVAKNEI
jgi:diguanylate cyclase